jgi:hypothetical protein
MSSYRCNVMISWSYSVKIPAWGDYKILAHITLGKGRIRAFGNAL